ncbi:MAG: zinc ribbon domain-containing protein [Candidatus Hadarchaeum sp.]|uniref:zinc ribbon domain-containing protein n=1 Tax=Candidatus Hadarchaeum sp. TaxID=2883567 RepID=UPI003D11C796
METWPHAKHCVDSAIKQAYSILRSWRKNYLRGNRTRNKPRVKRRFVRVKETLYTFRGGRLRVTIDPWGQHVEFDLRHVWFWGRAEGELGEIILKDDSLTVTFRRGSPKPEPNKRLAWDSNEASLDAFDPELGWVRMDLRKLYHVHSTYELKRKRLQGRASKKPSIRRVSQKYRRRERNRARDIAQKITTELARTLPDTEHRFECLEKEKMFNRGKNHNRRLAKTNWSQVRTMLRYKARVGKPLNPRNSTRRCSRCGGLNGAPKGVVFECRFCGLRINRQLNAAVNLYLPMEGLSHDARWFDRAVGGFDLTGEKREEGPNEPLRSPSVMVPKENVVTIGHVF